MARTPLEWAFLCFTDRKTVGLAVGEEGAKAIIERYKKSSAYILREEVLSSHGVPVEKHELVRGEVKAILEWVQNPAQYGFDPNRIAKEIFDAWPEAGRCGDRERSWIVLGLNIAISTQLKELLADEDFRLILADNQYQMQKALHGVEAEIQRLQEEVKRMSRPEVAILSDQAATYRNRWKSVFFLEDDRKHSPVKLSALYLNPPYQMVGKEDDQFDLHDLLEGYLSGTAESNMLVIRGQPGGGKSTLISYILNKCECRRVIRVYQLKELDVEWEGKTPLGVADALLKALNLENNKGGLKNSVLILDGFDEVAVGKWRKDILDALYREWCEQVEDFTLLLTCRVNALPEITGNDWDYITLSPWNEEQIETFSENYWRVRGKRPEDQDAVALLKRFREMKGIMGLPLVLYMALALDLKAEKAASVTDVYNEIFSLERGRIWHRSYSPGGESEETYKNELYALSKKAAWNMWVNNPDKAVIKGTELEKEAKLILGENREGELTELLRRFSMVRHSEGRAETEFIHRTIYEYFAALTIFDVIRNYLQDETDIPDKVTAELAELMSVRVLSPDIEGHLERLVEKSEPADKCKEGWRDWFGQRLENGMQPSGADVGGLTWIDQEMQCFQNYIKLLRPILGRNTENKYCKLWRDNDSNAKEFMSRYIRNAVRENNRIDYAILDLSGAELLFTNLSLADLRGANLQGANLQGANLHGANLRDANLHSANLRGTNLCLGVLRDVSYSVDNLHRKYHAMLWDVKDLTRANLTGANLYNAALSGANLGNVNLENVIILKSALKDVRYDPKKMKKAILLRGNLRPVHRLTEEQKAILRNHGFKVADN